MKKNVLILAALVMLSIVTNAIFLLTANGGLRAWLLGQVLPAKVGQEQALPAPLPARAPTPELAPSAVAAGPSAQARVHPGKGEGRGMTWGRVADADGAHHQLASVGCHGSPPTAQGGAGCDPYRGDTSCQATLALLCLRKESLTQAEAIDGPLSGAAHGQAFYNGWTGARMALSRPVSGRRLGTATAGDELCSAEFGSGWRMAEFHDGGGGWGFRGVGNIDSSERFWVGINDQRANCWDSSPDAASPAIATDGVPASKGAALVRR